MKLMLCAAILAATAATAADLPIVHHEATVRFDLAQKRVMIKDEMAVPAGLDSFQLAERFVISTWHTPGGDLLSETGESFLDSSLGEPLTRPIMPPGSLPVIGDQPRAIRLNYSARVHQNAATMQFSRENVANEVSGTIGDDGIYLSGDLPWLPSFDGALNTYKITVVTPLGWLPVTNGAVVSETEIDGMLHTVFSAQEPADGITLIAQKYYRYETNVGRDDTVVAQIFLLQPDDKLRDLYLERTRAYVQMYEEMLGPYPFGKFATVENWFPTGYGMPGWTLLGAQVMRLPFIPYTSFGHEVAHNWWGNSVMVDPAEGNWCEGLTSWCADYHYKELESPQAARDYRRTLLKDYAAYVGPDPALDFPLTEFKSRHSGATRAVGYGKSMMVWHMLDQRYGREKLLAALRQVYAERKFQLASWNDFFTALDGSGDLAGFKEQWLTRAGAPVLHVDDVKRAGDKVTFKLWQESPTYVLDVPVVATTPAGPVRQMVRLDGQRGEFTLTAPGATRLSVDPDYDLFRRLHREEIEPTLSQVLAEASPLFILPPDAAQEAAATGFATAFTETDPPAILSALPQDVDVEGAVTAVVMNPGPETLKAYVPAELQVAGDLVFLDGKRYNLKDYDLVFAARNPGHQSITDLVVISRSPDRLPRLGERLGHYGKYSWLLLPAGAGQTLKGNWSPAGNPLAIDLKN